MEKDDILKIRRLTDDAINLEASLKEMKQLKGRPTAIGFHRAHYNRRFKKDTDIQFTIYCSDNEYLRRAVKKAHDLFIAEVEKELKKCINELELKL